MANGLFGWPLYEQPTPLVTPAWSGGSFLASLPLTNVADRRLQKIARTTNALAASTKLQVDLGAARAVGLLAILLPNVTKTAVPTVQWKGGTTLGASDVYAPAAQQAWPTGVTVEDVTAPDGTTMNVWTTTIPATLQTARFWECDVVDTANADGHLDVARVIVAGAYQPTEPIMVGATTGHESESVRTVTDGGAALYQPKPRRRVDVFSIDQLSQAESLGTARKMIRQLGTTSQLFFVFDPSDTTLMYERAYLAVLSKIDPFTYSTGVRTTNAYGIMEEL
jgi:hypothetical protein